MDVLNRYEELKGTGDLVVGADPNDHKVLAMTKKVYDPETGQALDDIVEVVEKKEIRDSKKALTAQRAAINLKIAELNKILSDYPETPSK